MLESTEVSAVPAEVTLRLPRCSPRDRVVFKPTAEFGWRHWPSALHDVVCVHLLTHATCGACHLRVLRRGRFKSSGRSDSVHLDHQVQLRARTS